MLLCILVAIASVGLSVFCFVVANNIDRNAYIPKLAYGNDLTDASGLEEQIFRQARGIDDVLADIRNTQAAIATAQESSGFKSLNETAAALGRFRRDAGLPTTFTEASNAHDTVSLTRQRKHQIEDDLAVLSAMEYQLQVHLDRAQSELESYKEYSNALYERLNRRYQAVLSKYDERINKIQTMAHTLDTDNSALTSRINQVKSDDDDMKIVTGEEMRWLQMLIDPKLKRIEEIVSVRELEILGRAGTFAGRIMRIDVSTDDVYIDAGSADGLVTNTVFAIFDSGRASGREFLKGYMKIKAVRRNDATARLTRTLDGDKPVIAKDLIASVFFPGGKTFVCKGRLPEDSPFTTARFYALIEKNGGVVKDYIDTDTDYFVLLDAVPRFPDETDIRYRELYEEEMQLIRQWAALDSDAMRYGVPSLRLDTLAEFLE